MSSSSKQQPLFGRKQPLQEPKKPQRPSQITFKLTPKSRFLLYSKSQLIYSTYQHTQHLINL